MTDTMLTERPTLPPGVCPCGAPRCNTDAAMVYRVALDTFEAAERARRAAEFEAHLAARAIARCRCGKREYPTEADARKAEPHGAFKCPDCHTFALSHAYADSGPDGDGRCSECDCRWGSHGGPQPYSGGWK